MDIERKDKGKPEENTAGLPGKVRKSFMNEVALDVFERMSRRSSSRQTE